MIDLYESLPFENEMEKSDDKTVGYLEEHFLGKHYAIYERLSFSNDNRTNESLLRNILQHREGKRNNATSIG